MKKQLLFSCFLFGWWAVCFTAAADFYMVAGTTPVKKEIKSIPYTISSPGFYYIAKDVSCAPGHHGITVASDDATIDLMGFTMTGPGTGTNHGIYMNARSNVEIRNGTVTLFGSNGIYEQSQSSGRDHRIYNIRARSNRGGGIIIFGKGAHIEDCTASGNTEQGIFAGMGSKVVGNTALENGEDGIYGNGGNLVARNVSAENSGYGIFAANGSTITGNVVYNNDQSGIYAASGCTVTDNSSAWNLMSGIEAGATTWAGAVVSGNTCYGNKHHGIVAGNATIIRGNTCYSNDYHGIFLAYHSFVDKNIAYANNQSLGTYLNISECYSCTFGLNHDP